MKAELGPGAGGPALEAGKGAGEKAGESQ
jgi:hypothetical protein